MAMDKAAKRRLRQALQGEPATNQRLSGERMVVTHCGVKQSQINKKALHQEIHGKVIKAKWVERHKIPEHLVDHNIAWPELGRAMTREPFGKRRWLTKHCAGQCGVGKCLLRRQHQAHDRCPRCDAREEDTTHVLRCPAISAHNTWQTALDKLETWLLNEGTQPTLTQSILAN